MTIPVLANDSDVDGDALTVTMLTWLGERNGDDEAKDAAKVIDDAVGRVLKSKSAHTGDLGGKAKTGEVGDAVAAEV